MKPNTSIKHVKDRDHPISDVSYNNVYNPQSFPRLPSIEKKTQMAPKVLVDVEELEEVAAGFIKFFINKLTSNGTDLEVGRKPTRDAELE